MPTVTNVDTNASASTTSGGVTTTTTTYLRNTITCTEDLKIYFDQSSYKTLAGTTSIRIVPYEHWTNKWAWFAFRTAGGAQPEFAIAKANHYNMVSGERLCCWATAADTDTWNDFDNVTIGETDLTFSNDDAFPAGVIWVSALPMYPFSRVQRKVDAWSQSQWVGQTISTTNFILGNATERVAMDNKTVLALPFYGFKITGDRVGNKNKAILSAYSHPSETPGAYQLEGAIDYLLGASAEAEVLRDYFEFYVYPCTNPQGVWCGWFRSSPEYVGPESHDGLWDEAGAGKDESVDAFKAAMIADTGGAIDVGIDYHSIMTNTDILCYSHTGDTGGNYAYFTTEMQALDADFNLLQAADTVTCYYFYRTMGASLAITPEMGGELARNVPEYKTYGQQTMQALYEMLIDGRFTYEP